jgi:lysophospholipase
MEEQRRFLEKYENHVLPFYRSGRFGEFSGAGGLKIRTIAFDKKQSSGALVILPGKSETYLKYAEFFYDLRDLPLSLYAMDHRGMGFSERPLPDRLKMHVERFDEYVEDLAAFVDTVVEAGGYENLYLFGHSTGALIAALYMEEHPDTFQAGVLCSPFFDLATGPIPGFLTRFLAGLLDRPGRSRQYGPGQRDIHRPEFHDNTITNCYPRWSLWEEDLIPNNEAIQFGGVTNHWLHESLTAGHRAVKAAGEISIPLLLLQAEQDNIVKLRAQDRFCRQAPHCRKVLIRGAKHEILLEQDKTRTEAIARIKGFLATRLKGA